MKFNVKEVIVAVEGQDWWPKIGNLNVVLGVVGFSLAIRLGTKLQVSNSLISKKNFLIDRTLKPKLFQ